jgi:anti-sigma factor RsiW
MRESHITHRLTAYIDGELPPEEQRKIEEHLSVCPLCRNELETLRSFWMLVAEGLGTETEDERPVPALWPAIVSRLERERTRRRSWMTSWAEWWRRARRPSSPALSWPRLAAAQVLRTPFAYAIASAVAVGVLAGAGLERNLSLSTDAEPQVALEEMTLDPVEYSSLLETPEGSLAALFGFNGLNSSEGAEVAPKEGI